MKFILEIEEIIKTLNFSNIICQILAPIIFSLADVLSGFIQAIINKDVDSSKMREGLLHKVLIILIVILSFIADITFSLSFLSKIVCIYVIIMEAMSILENFKKAGINLGKLAEIIKLGKEEEKSV